MKKTRLPAAKSVGWLKRIEQSWQGDLAKVGGQRR